MTQSNTTMAWSISEAVKESGLGRSFLYNLMGEGKLPYIKIGKRRLILAEDLRQFLENARVMA